jgi:hypothetical protein
LYFCKLLRKQTFVLIIENDIEGFLRTGSFFCKKRLRDRLKETSELMKTFKPLLWKKRQRNSKKENRLFLFVFVWRKKSRNCWTWFDNLNPRGLKRISWKRLVNKKTWKKVQTITNRERLGDSLITIYIDIYLHWVFWSYFSIIKIFLNIIVIVPW